MSDETRRIRLRCVELAVSLYTQPPYRLEDVEDSILEYADELAAYAMHGKAPTPKEKIKGQSDENR